MAPYAHRRRISPTNVENLKINTLWDGLFHAATYIFVVLGLIVLWRASRRSHIRRSSKLLLGSILMGFGVFNLVEGVVDHHLLGIHHVNETVPREQWIYWDVGFLAWGAAMLIGGWSLFRAGRRETRQRAHTPTPARPVAMFQSRTHQATSSPMLRRAVRPGCHPH